MMENEKELFRVCNVCGQPMLEGYVIDDGVEYYCCDDCLHSAYTEEEYIELCMNDLAYWTQWEEYE